MATLTTSWASYASASQTVSGQTVKFYLEARYSTQSTTSNTSTVYTRLRSEVIGAIRGSGYKFTCTYCDERSGTGVWTFEDEVIISSPAKTITHNTDGKKSISLSATAKNTYWNINKSMSVTVDLPKINRLATVTNADNFTDEGNPTLTFDNPAGFTVKPYLNFYDKNNTLVYQLNRDTSITTPYTWQITNDERTALRNATNQQLSYKVNIGVDTFNGNTKLGSNSIQKTMSYVNAEPTQEIDYEETNENVISVLNSTAGYTVIQNASQLLVSTTPTALKSATITNVLINNTPITTTPYELIVPITTNEVGVTVIDSRGNTNTETIIYDSNTFIEYEPIDILSVSFNRYSPTSSDVILNAEIKYIQQTFGNTANVPTIKWKKGEEGTLNTLSTSDYTIDVQNNKIIISDLTLSDAIPYTDEDRFYFYANDLLTEDEDSKSVVGRGIPTFEAGEYDFQVNGDLFIADTNRQNPVDVGMSLDWLKTQTVLWSGAWYMNGSQSIDLSNTPFSSQPHGVLLLWSAYNSSSGAQDWDWVCNFIPKSFAELQSTNGMLFNMNALDYSNVGTKYIYVSDARLTGHNNNALTGTASGISFKNNHWVLRYVISV